MDSLDCLHCDPASVLPNASWSQTAALFAAPAGSGPWLLELPEIWLPCVVWLLLCEEALPPLAEALPPCEDAAHPVPTQLCGPASPPVASPPLPPVALDSWITTDPLDCSHCGTPLVFSPASWLHSAALFPPLLDGSDPWLLELPEIWLPCVVSLWLPEEAPAPLASALPPCVPPLPPVAVPPLPGAALDPVATMETWVWLHCPAASVLPAACWLHMAEAFCCAVAWD